MFMDVEFAAEKGGSLEVSLVLDVVLVERSSKVNFWLTAGVEVVVVDVDVVLLEGKVNLGVMLLRVELEIVNLLVVADELSTVENLLELAIVDDLGRVLVLAEDLAVREAHALVFGVYSGPCGGYGLVDAVSVALVVVFWLLLGIIDDDLLVDFVDDLTDEVVEDLLVETAEILLEVLLELKLTGLLEDWLAEVLDDLLAEMLDSLLAEMLDDLPAKMVDDLLVDTVDDSLVEATNDALVEMLALLLDNEAEARLEYVLEGLLEDGFVTTLDGWSDDLLASRPLLLEELTGTSLDVLVDLIALTGQTLDGALLRDRVVDDAAGLPLDVGPIDLLLGTRLLEIERCVD